jgi:hypothetical protein
MPRLFCRNVLLAAAALTFFTFVPRASFAQGNDLSAPTGGRSALMGNTGVALASDGAGPFLNPATIVRIKDQRLAFSVNFYSLGFTHFSNWHQPGAVDPQYGSGDLAKTGLTTNSFRVLPSTLCLFFNLQEIEKIVVSQNLDAATSQPTKSDFKSPRKKLAICFAALESDDLNLQAIQLQSVTPAGTTAQVQSFSSRWNRTYVGPTYSAYATQNLAIGGSAQAVYSYDSFGFDGSSITSKVGGGAIGSQIGTSGSGHSFDLTAIVGATYKRDDVTFGLSVRAPSLHLLGSYQGTFSQSNTGSSGDAQVVASGTGSFRAPAPMRLAAGAGWETRRFTFEVDAAVDIPILPAVTTSLDVSTNTLQTGINTTLSKESDVIHSHATIDPGIGIEYFWSPTFSLLGGLAANLSSLSPLSPSNNVGNVVQQRTNRIIGSFGIGSYGDGKQLLFGGQAQYGWGDSMAINPYVLPNEWDVVKTQSYSVMLIVSGATDLRSITRAAERVKNAVTTGDPNLSPTKKGPVEKTPAERTPADKTPAEKTPAEKTPADKTPADKTPADKAVQTPPKKTWPDKAPPEKTPADKTP